MAPAFIFSWFRTRRRQRWQKTMFPDNWSNILHHQVHQYRHLSSDARAKLHGFIQVFVLEKNWEGCGGFELTDEVKVTISGWVGILVLGRQPEFFDQVLSILVYPTAYKAPVKTPAGGGVMLEGQSAREGEAWYRGPVILSWNDIKADRLLHREGQNLVLHEFAHQLDMQDGLQTNGIPILPRSLRQSWIRVMSEAYGEHVKLCEWGQNWLDPYAASNPQEFFAVLTEAFFETPFVLHRRAPEVFAQLQAFYRIDPREMTTDGTS